MEGSDDSELPGNAGSRTPAVSIDRPDPSVVDALVDLWVALATDQRAHDSHILPDGNRALVRDTLARHAVTGSVRVARARGADEPIGFVAFDIEHGAYEQDETRGIVRNVYVEPAYRRNGVGGALMDEAEAALRDAGATVVTLEAMAGNRSAREFYRERGYEPHRVQFEKPVEGGTNGGSHSERATVEPSAENDTHSKED